MEAVTAPLGTTNLPDAIAMTEEAVTVTEAVTAQVVVAGGLARRTTVTDFVATMPTSTPTLPAAVTKTASVRTDTLAEAEAAEIDGQSESGTAIGAPADAKEAEGAVEMTDLIGEVLVAATCSRIDGVEAGTEVVAGAMTWIWNPAREHFRQQPPRSANRHLT